MKINNYRGIALIAAYLIIVLLLVLGGSFIIRSLSEKKVADAQRTKAQALHIAEAGLEKSLYQLRQDFLTDPSPSWIDGDIYGITVTTPNPANQNAYYTLFSSTALDNGTYETSIKYVFSGNNAQPDEIWVKSVGTVSGITRTIQEYAKMKNISPWNNAIFAGTGASGSAIDGNVTINGSVHILGSGLAHTDVAIDIGGTGSMGNNYRGIPDVLSDRIPDCPRINFNNELVDSLSAELRVKNGRVDISGNATVGQPNLPGNSYKETIDGLYIDVGNYDGDNQVGTFYDGFGGNKGPSGANSDNGTTHNYDLGNAVSFPSLSDPYQTYATYEEYLNANSLHVNQSLIGTINASTPNFEYGTPGQNYIKWTQSTRQLQIEGIVTIDPLSGQQASNLSLGSKSNPIEYVGRGTFFVTGDLAIHGDLLSKNTFPTTDALGIIAKNNVNLATGSGDAQLNMIGAFYAEGEVTSAKQNEVAGTFVSNYFNMGTNVPKIYQVPDLVSNLPPGMPGATASWILVTRGWQEL